MGNFNQGKHNNARSFNQECDGNNYGVVFQRGYGNTYQDQTNFNWFYY